MDRESEEEKLITEDEEIRDQITWRPGVSLPSEANKYAHSYSKKLLL